MVVRGASCGRTRTLHSCTGATAKPAPYIYNCRRQSLGLSQSAAHSRLFGATRNITTRINATCSDRKAPSTMTLIGFNLVEELTFYGAYHNNPVNQLIHFIFVPLILWTAAVWLAYTPALFELDLAGILFFLPPGVVSLLSDYTVFNGSFVLLSFYAMYYTILEPFAGLSWTVGIAFPLWATSEAFVANVPLAWAYGLGLHVFSWFMQVYFGHSVAEKRKPALMDSLIQSLLLAPLFVWFELLFLLGYRKRLRMEVQKRIDEDIATWKATSAMLLEKNDPQTRSE